MLRKVTTLQPLSKSSSSSSASSSLSVHCSRSAKYCADIIYNHHPNHDESSSKSSSTTYPLVRLNSSISPQQPSLSIQETIEKVIVRSKGFDEFSSFLSLDALRLQDDLVQAHKKQCEDHRRDMAVMPTLQFTAPTHKKENKDRKSVPNSTSSSTLEILPLHFSEAAAALPKKPPFFSEVVQPINFTFRSQSGPKKFFGYPVNIAARDKTSGIIFVGGRTSLLHTICLPHLNVPLMYFPAAPSSQSLQESSSASSSDSFQNNNNNNNQSQDGEDENKIKRSHLQTLTNHIKKINSGCDRILNNFFTPESNVRYSGENKIVLLNNDEFFDDINNKLEQQNQQQNQNSSSSSAIILRDGMEAIRQVKLICAALSEATFYIKSENQKIVEQLSQVKRDQRKEASKMRTLSSTLKGTKLKKETAAVLKRIDEMERQKQFARDQISEKTRSLWQHCFCKVLDSHLRDQGCLVSLVEILSGNHGEEEVPEFHALLNEMRFRQQNNNSAHGRGCRSVEEFKAMEHQRDMKMLFELIESWTGF